MTNKKIQYKTKNKNKPKKLKEILEGQLTKKEMGFLTSSFDTVGSIAIIEIVPELRHKEKLIGDSIIGMHKQITTVCRRDGNHSGVFRTQKLKIVAGKKTKETTHMESRCKLSLDVENCYFSVRSSSERLRIAKLIDDKVKKSNKKEDVLVMFSGIAPFVCVLAKNAKESINNIIGIELNPIAHKYAEKNILQNKLKNASAINGDVRKIVPTLKNKKTSLINTLYIKFLALFNKGNNIQKFDRIIMPLPRSAEEFLDTALIVAKKGTWIHLYGFLSEDEFDKYKQKIIDISSKMGHKVNIHGIVKCGQFSPRLYRICVDFKIL